MERKTYRISKQQHARLKRMKQHLERDAGQRLSWQHVLSTAIEAGLTASGYAPIPELKEGA